MKSLNQTLVALFLGATLLSACGEKQAEMPVVATDASKAPVAVEPIKAEPVKEEPGGWVPPAEDRVPGITVPATPETAAATPETAAPVAPEVK